MGCAFHLRSLGLPWDVLNVILRSKFLAKKTNCVYSGGIHLMLRRECKNGTMISWYFYFSMMDGYHKRFVIPRTPSVVVMLS